MDAPLYTPAPALIAAQAGNRGSVSFAAKNAAHARAEMAETRGAIARVGRCRR